MKEQCKFCCTKLENISVKFNKNTVVDNVTMHLHCGEITAIIGKNGAGKSTLLKAIIGVVEHSGKVIFTSKHKKSNQLTIGYVPQLVNIENSPLSVYDLICSYISNVPVFLYKSKKVYNKIKEHMKEFKISYLIDEKVSDLSGGQLQRVLIACATMPEPEILILDEPVSGIDEEGRKQLYMLLNKLKCTHDIAILMVSHDLENVRNYADNVILLNKRILISGSPKGVFASKEFQSEFGGIKYGQ